MDRDQWRRERRLWNEVRMDTIDARHYDEHWGGYINPTHRAMVEHFFDLCPAGSQILDAACGTGKYWPLLLERGFSVTGTVATHPKNIRFINPPTLSTPPGFTHVVEITHGRTVFIAGQVAFDQAGQVVGQHDFRAQTQQ